MNMNPESVSTRTHTSSTCRIGCASARIISRNRVLQTVQRHTRRTRELIDHHQHTHCWGRHDAVVTVCRNHERSAATPFFITPSNPLFTSAGSTPRARARRTAAKSKTYVAATEAFASQQMCTSQHDAVASCAVHVSNTPSSSASHGFKARAVD
jgi:hypothetical protein